MIGIDTVERCIAGGIVVLLALTFFHVYGAVTSPVPVRLCTGSDHLPNIPQCDKELWLRIKDGCSINNRGL